MSERSESGRGVQDHISAAFRHENVADLGGDEEMNAIVAAGPPAAATDPPHLSTAKEAP